MQLSLFDETGSEPRLTHKLPDEVVDRFGHRVVTSEEIWNVFDPACPYPLKWKQVVGLSESLLYGLKFYICHSLASGSPREAINTFNEIKMCAGLIGKQSQPCGEITYGVFESLRTKLRTISREYRLHRFRAWYIWMADTQLPWADAALAREIKEWRIPGNEKGVAVMSMDPEQGPLTEAEFQLVTKRIKETPSFNLGKIATMLCLELGSNSKNLLLLEERDLVCLTLPGSNKTIFQIDVPRIKKRLVVRRVKRRSISDALGVELLHLIEHNRQMFGCQDPKRPLLCRSTERPSNWKYGAEAQRYAYHYTNTEFRKLVISFCAACDFVSPRTGEPLKINIRRLRYTFASRLARQGTPAAIIAELLDHTDLQNVFVYVKSGPEVIDRLDRALDKQLRPIIGLFLGKIVESEAAANPSDNPSRRILGATPTNLNLGGIGTCGSKSICNLYPPRSCYLCEHFQPWRDAPHEKMLTELLNYVEQLAVSGGNNPSNRMPVQIENLISAVAEVVRLCKRTDTAQQ